MYFLAPYSHGTVSACVDCEIVIGAVAGALIVNGCERVKIVTTARKILVNNCLDCEFHIACLSPTLISGDSRGLVVGPFNAAYRHLKLHMQIAGLGALLTSQQLPSPPYVMRIDMLVFRGHNSILLLSYSISSIALVSPDLLLQ